MTSLPHPPRAAGSRIDVHAHFVPDAYRDELIRAGHSRPDGRPSIPAWSETAALAAMDALDVRTSILSIASPGVHFGDDAAARRLARAMNEEGARLVTAHPGRFGLFASLPLPDVDGAIAEAAYALDELDADGVIVQTNSRGMYLGDERLAPLYAALHERNAILFVHPTSPTCAGCAELALGYPIPILELMFETTRSITDLLLAGMTLRYPRMRIVVPHAGAVIALLAGRIKLLASALPKTAGTAPHVRDELGKLYYDLAGAPVPEQLTALLQIADPRRILYGSDWPWTPLSIARDLARILDNTILLSRAQRDHVMMTNAVDLLDRVVVQGEA